MMSRTVAIWLLIGANLLWGSSYVVTKVALTEIPPPLLAALRFSLATVLIGLVMLWQRRRGDLAGPGRALAQLSRGDTVKLASLGLIGISLSYLLSYWGLSLTTATDAALMIICEVIFTSLLAVWLIGERLGLAKKLGITLGIGGVIIVVLGNATGSALAGAGLLRAGGDLLIIAGLFCQALYSVLGTGLARKVQPLVLLAVTYSGSLLLWLPLLLWYLASGRFPVISLPTIAAIIYLAGVISLLCFFIWFSALPIVGANLGAVSLLIQPVVGALLGIMLLGDPITLSLTGGGPLIMLAFYLTARPDPRPTHSPGSLAG
jgi:drug/metabolite transporter (DMT)-like permease